MKVLVAVASRHGATMGIGSAIAARLIESGVEAELASVDAVPSLDGFDAVVLGSGVYAGHWLGEARRFVDRHEEELRARRVWLFSSGPLGDPPKPDEAPAEALPIRELIGAEGHRVFAGRIDRSMLGLGEKAILAVVRAPAGDYRDWDEVAAWTASIADALKVPVPA